MENLMRKDMAKILITEEELQARIKEMGKEISKDYEGKTILMVTVLKGAVMFMTDLARALDIHVEMDFMACASYEGGTKSTGAVRMIKDLEYDIEGKDVLIIEDILDSGLTLNYLTNMLKKRNPASLRICTLLDKPARRKSDIKADYSGFVIPDEFIVGYGLDYEDKYRNTSYIGVLKPEVYTK